MADIKIVWNKKLKTINKEFQEQFPYLLLAFFAKKDKKKVEKRQEVFPLDQSLRICDVWEDISENNQEISINGNTKVENLEKGFFETFGVYLQVCMISAEGIGYYTEGKEDQCSLSELNRLMEKNGCQKYPKINDEIDNGTVKADIVTLACKVLHTILHEKNSAFESVVPSRHYATGSSVNDYREYIVEVEDEVLEHFFIEYNPEDEELYYGFSVIAPEKGKKVFKEALSEACEENKLDCNEYQCYKTQNMSSREEFENINPEKLIKEILEMFKLVKTICANL